MKTITNWKYLSVEGGIKDGFVKRPAKQNGKWSFVCTYGIEPILTGDAMFTFIGTS